MHVRIMPAPRPHPAQPRFPTMPAAQLLLDRRIDQQPVEPRHLRRQPDQGDMAFGEVRRVHPGPIRQHQRDFRNPFPLRRRHQRLGVEVEPYIGIDPGLMAGMAEGHRPTARLREVADPQVRQPHRPGAAGEGLDPGDHRRVPPMPVARNAHRLPARPLVRQFHRARDAAKPRAADDAHRPGRRPRHRPPDLRPRNVLRHRGAVSQQRHQDAEKCLAHARLLEQIVVRRKRPIP